jgi:hypothetical protein
MGTLKHKKVYVFVDLGILQKKEEFLALLLKELRNVLTPHKAISFLQKQKNATKCVL